MKIWRVEGHLCPACRAILDAVGSLTGGSAPPKAGDYTICGECGAILRYSADLKLAELSLTELAEMDEKDPMLFQLLLQVRENVQRRVSKKG
jgi:hypothetical protein